MQLGLNCQITVIIIINPYPQPRTMCFTMTACSSDILIPRQVAPDIWPLDVPLVTVITVIKQSLSDKHATSRLKGYSTFFLEIGSFYHSPRVKQLGFTVFKSIQPIFGYLEEYQ